jgi:four helix bundle protein
VILDFGFWILDSGFWILDFGFWILDSGLGIGDSGLGIADCGFGIADSGFWIGESFMNEREFKARTNTVALRVIKVVEALPSTLVAGVIGKQLLRSGTGVGANYRAACRGKSPADVIAKLAIVEEEADESIYWLELLIDASILSRERLSDLIDELNQIVAMIVASQKTLRRNNPKSRMTVDHRITNRPASGQSKIQNPE